LEASVSAAYGVRLTAPGPNRLAVLARVRPILGRPPAEVRAALDGGGPVLLAIDVGLPAAEGMAEDLRRLGASVEIFVSDPCPSLCFGLDAGA
jgi:hypothetical protein